MSVKPKPGDIRAQLRYVAEYLCEQPEADSTWLLIDATDESQDGLYRMAKALGMDADIWYLVLGNLTLVRLLYNRVLELEAL